MKHLVQLEWAYIATVLPLWVDNVAQAVAIPDTVYWQRIPIVELVAMEQIQELEKGARKYQVKISAFLQDCHIPYKLERRAYRLTDSAGNRYLLGYRNAPLPLTLISDTRPDNSSERAVRTLTITAETPLLLIK